MSAWIVSQAHVDALVNAAMPSGSDKLRYHHEGEWQVVEYGDKDNIGQMLVDECVRSVSHRYPGDDVAAGELPGPTDAYYLQPYKHRIPGAALPAVWILSAIHCFDYQGCEHPEWPDSEAYAFLKALEAHWIRKVPGYSDAPWGLEDEHVKPSNAVSTMDLIDGTEN